MSALVVAVTIPSASVRAEDLPGLRAPLLDTPATPSTFRNGITATATGGPSIEDAEIQELARGLKYDPGLIYKFVHDHIRFEPMWGEVKGPYMTWMDRGGNAFDQAALTIALLEEAADHSTEYTITDPCFVVGEIQLTDDQFVSWFGIREDPNDATVAEKMLARAGLYGTVTATGTEISSVNLEHVWVKVTIDGNDYKFDPSFKSHTIEPGLWNLDQVMGYGDGSDFIDDANDGVTYGTVGIQDVNKPNIAGNLATYSGNLIDYVKTNKHGADLADIIGGRRIDPVEDSNLPPSSPPYTVESNNDDGFPITDIPDMYRATLRIQHCGIDETFFSSDVYGRRLSLKYNGSNQPQLVLDGTVEATGSATTSGQLYDLTLTVDHPFDSNDFDDTATVKVTSGGFYTIVNGWGQTGAKILKKHRDDLEQYRFDGESDSSEKVLGESFTLLGMTWLAQISQMRSMAAEIADSSVAHHHTVGLAGQTDSNDAPYLDMPLGSLGVTNFDEDPSLEKSLFLTIAGHASAYEHEVIRQIHDCNAVSTVRLFEMANDRTTYDEIAGATSSNWSTKQQQLQGYSQDEKDDVNDYIDDGYKVYLPEYGDLSEEDWTGIGFRAYKFTQDCLAAAHVIGGGWSGGAASADANLSPATVFDNCYGSEAGRGGNGAYGFGATDLAIGSGGYPFGLSFSRRYSSRRRLEDGPLGLGWTHNLDISIKLANDTFQFLGVDSPQDAAPHIVSLYVVWDVLDNDEDQLLETVTATLCQSWLMDQMTNKVAVIKQGGGIMKFVKDPNWTDGDDPCDMYIAPPGQNLKLGVRSDTGNFLLRNSSGIFMDFDSSGRLDEWTDVYGNKVDFTYTSGKLTQVASKVGGSTTSYTISLTYTGDHITSVTDSASRSVSYEYDANDQLIEFTNLDGNDVTYDYNDVTDGLIEKIYSPIDDVNAVLEIKYDSLERMMRQTDANDVAWDYYNATYRVEVLEPNQTDPCGVTKRFSTIRWANPETKKTISTDQLGRQTTVVYDGQLRLDSVLGASGMSANMTYDENHNVTEVESISIAGSGDPNVSLSGDYGGYEDPNTGRWFRFSKTSTDFAGNTTYYYYDCNDPNVYSNPKRQLLKVVYPQVDAPSDTNRPVEEFTYNSYGQILTKTDPEGLITAFEYDTLANASRLKKVIVDYNTTDANHVNATTEYTYDSAGRVISIKDPLGNTTTKSYHDSGLLRKVTAPSPFSYETEYEYYDDGRLKYVTTEVGGETVYLQAITYNKRGQKATVRGPYPDDPNSAELAINYAQYRYDALGRPWQVEDAEGNVTETRYYPDGKVWRAIDAEDHNVVTKYYNDDGSLKRIEDANDNATEYEYNGFMKVKKLTYPDDTYEQFTYDLYRRLSKKRTRSGQEISFTYDDLGRIKTKDVNDTVYSAYSNTISYTYDLTGRLLEVTDGTGTISNSYDYAGRLVDVNYPGDRGVSYAHDDASNRTKLVYPDDSYITYEYDALGRLTKVRNDANTVLAEYTYDARSRRTDLTYANGASIDYSYDTASRLLDINNVTDTHLEYAYTYDDVGNRLSMIVTDSNGAGTHAYTYDDIYQLTDVNYPTGYSYLADDSTFNYDAVGNRTSVVAGGTTNYSVNALNQYTSVGSDGYTYDDNGNLTYDGAGKMYAYDPENRLRMVTKVNGPLAPACDTNLRFATGGDANWVVITEDYHFDRDAIESGSIGNDESTWVEATVCGQGTIKFHKAVSCDTGDSLSFRIDGQYQAGWSGSSGSYAEYEQVISEQGVHTLRWTYSKDPNSSSAGDDCARLDYVRWVQSTGSSYLKNALDTPTYVDTEPNRSWLRTTSPYYNDGDSAKSGDIDDDEESVMEATVNGEKTISFYWKVSSESNCDWLEFYIDGVRQDRISGTVNWQKKTYTTSGCGPHSLLWKYVKDSSGSSGSDRGWVDYLEGCGVDSSPPPLGSLAEATDCEFTFTTGGDDYFNRQYTGYYYDGDVAQNDDIDDDQESWMQATVECDSQETLSFYWKVSSENNYDWLEFYIDGNREDRISGDEDWDQSGPHTVSAGTHTFKWRYVKDESVSDGSDCGWVDYIQWSGPGPEADPIPMPTQWDQLTYEYDPSGRRIEKAYDGTTVVKYVYDGGQCIAEYDGNDELLRKYIYGPCVDEPICMIDVNDSNAVYYYHFDALGSVVALSDSSGDTVQVYEYSVFGQVAASDPNHTNPFLFTGRRFDSETGLYYYRARYYNPYIGRFLQTDPIGYGDGMNWHSYCHNNPTNGADPSGTDSYGFLPLDGDSDATLTFARFGDAGDVLWSMDFESLGIWMRWAAHNPYFDDWGADNLDPIQERVGWELSGGNRFAFWNLQAIIYMAGYKDEFGTWEDRISSLDATDMVFHVITASDREVYVDIANRYDHYGDYSYKTPHTLYWDPTLNSLSQISANWGTFPSLVVLIHELEHAHQRLCRDESKWGDPHPDEGRLKNSKPREIGAMEAENYQRYAFYTKVPGFQQLYPRPGYTSNYDLGHNARVAWLRYWRDCDYYPVWP